MAEMKMLRTDQFLAALRIVAQGEGAWGDAFVLVREHDTVLRGKLEKAERELRAIESYQPSFGESRDDVLRKLQYAARAVIAELDVPCATNRIPGVGARRYRPWLEKENS